MIHITPWYYRILLPMAHSLWVSDKFRRRANKHTFHDAYFSHESIQEINSKFESQIQRTVVFV